MASRVRESPPQGIAVWLGSLALLVLDMEPIVLRKCSLVYDVEKVMNEYGTLKKKSELVSK